MFLGLVLYGLSMAMMLLSALGNMPWDVLHEGLADRTGWSFGVITAVLSVLVLAAWVPLRQRPGVGTVANVVVVAVTVDAALLLLPAGAGLPARVALALAGVLLNALATAAYIGADLGPGPRDGLMTGLVARTGASVRLIRLAIEVTAVVLGWALGGTVGVVTVVYALAIGPLVQLLLPHLFVHRD